ncbi:hypothetical protein MA16_Dca013768 [Dendrobium catenatum]|uniref:Uncharacterized protein n=1 Tax=Dendrobium catenatum TaxID=906689 RepID=A0A2I0VWF3_9ASPA|nr:hypothetical protein MA16_Dca013768 [Dendrobium catenatum]
MLMRETRLLPPRSPPLLYKNAAAATLRGAQYRRRELEFPTETVSRADPINGFRRLRREIFSDVAGIEGGFAGGNISRPLPMVGASDGGPARVWRARFQKQVR